MKGKKNTMSSLIVTRRNAALGVLGAGTAAALAACSSSNSNSNSSGGSSSSSKSEPAKDYKGEVKFDSFDTSAGEYVPATRTEPAKNVPVPKLPENANEKSVEAFYAHIGYYAACMQYLFVTGDDGPFRKGAYKEDEVQLIYQDPTWSQVLPKVKNKEMWLGNPTATIETLTAQPEINGDRYKWSLQLSINIGEFTATPEGANDIPPGEGYAKAPGTFIGTYSDNKWSITTAQTGNTETVSPKAKSNG